MSLKSFSLGGVTYRQQLVKCGRACSKCPNHGPYWFAAWWAQGRVRTVYVGKKLPEGIAEPTEEPAQPALCKAMTKREAFRLMAIKPSDSYLVGHMRWETERKWLTKQGEDKRADLVRWNEAWEIVGALLK